MLLCVLCIALVAGQIEVKWFCSLLESLFSFFDLQKDFESVMAPVDSSPLGWEARVFAPSSTRTEKPAGRAGIAAAFAFGRAPWYIILLITLGSLTLAAAIVLFIVAFSTLKKRNETNAQVKADLQSNSLPKKALVSAIVCGVSSIVFFAVGAILAATVVPASAVA